MEPPGCGKCPGGFLVFSEVVVMAPPTDIVIGANLMERASLQHGKGQIEVASPSKPIVRNQEQKPEREKKPSLVQELQSAVDDMNRKAQDLQRSVRFSVERELNMTVVKVVNPQTDEVVRQIPAKEFIEIAKALKESRSLLFDAEV